MADETYDIDGLLSCIDPAALSYDEWLSVGMALHDGGYPWEVWDTWSRRDSARYTGDCRTKWRSFHGKARPVTMGSLVFMARQNGYAGPVPASDHRPAAEHRGTPSRGPSPARKSRDRFAPFPNGAAADGVAGRTRKSPWASAPCAEGENIRGERQRSEDRHGLPAPRVIRGGIDSLAEAWTVPLPGPGDRTPEEELREYLGALFPNDSDIVGYVTETLRDGGRIRPASAGRCRTAGELRAALETGSVEEALGGGLDPEGGAWLRVNPLDGAGGKDENVVDYRYTLVECDDLPVEEQLARIRLLELPAAALVYSGGKSLHAVVRVDAPDLETYRERSSYIYKTCVMNGLSVDPANKNPARLTRMPGVRRGERRQYLLGTNLGQPDFKSWFDFVRHEDGLPPTENLAFWFHDPPPLREPLIDGILRRGHKMLLTGPSKAGKSFALIELCAAIAEGRSWLDLPCRQGSVLYVNLELDHASCLRRFTDVYRALGLPEENVAAIDILNLRGYVLRMDTLADKLIRRIRPGQYDAIILDPVYKVLMGDENSAEDMAAFCAQFDRLCRETGAAVICCHHHSKGMQGGKRSMDRASGSGVFARDPDTIVDFIELDTKAGFSDSTAWRVETTLREFPRMRPFEVWFDWPVHVPAGTDLQNAKPRDEFAAQFEQRQPQQKKSGARKPYGYVQTPQQRQRYRDRREDELLEAYDDLERRNGRVTTADLAQRLRLTRQTVKSQIDMCPGMERSPDGQVFYDLPDDDELPDAWR